jgi:hypothetical protein
LILAAEVDYPEEVQSLAVVYFQEVVVYFQEVVEAV